MNDIVDRLLRWGMIAYAPEDLMMLLEEAAAEIVRLRDGWEMWHGEYMDAAELNVVLEETLTETANTITALAKQTNSPALTTLANKLSHHNDL